MSACTNQPPTPEDQAWRALTDLLPFVLEDYSPSCATPEYRRAVEAAKAVLGRAPVDYLSSCCPLVLFFADEEGRREFIRIVQAEGFKALKL